MTKRTRTVLFIVSILLFLLLCPFFILYPQGYRIDFKSQEGGVRIVRVGGIFLKVYPKRADVYVDGNLKKRGDYLSGDVFFEGLYPRKYKIEVKKTGYYTWEKTLRVKEKEVTDAKNIILFPEQLKVESITTGVKQFWFAPDKKKVVLEEEEKNGWAIKLYDIDQKLKSILFEEKTVFPKGVDFVNIEFSPDSKEIYLEIGQREQGKYFKIELEKSSSKLIPTEEPKFPIEEALSYVKSNGNTYYLDKYGYVFLIDSSNKEIKVNETPFEIKQETEYQLNIFQNIIFIRENNTLYQYNSQLASFEKLFEPVKEIQLSPDQKRLAYRSDSEAWVLFLKENTSMPQRKAGDKVFLLRFSEPIKEFFWLDSDYLIFNVNGTIKIAEIDDRDKVQVFNIGIFNDSKMFFNQLDKKIYLLSEGVLYGSDVLIP